MLWIDFETRSRCDLFSRGVYNYARDASTSVLCLSYAFDDEDVQSWRPNQSFPQRIVDYISAGGQIRAHNAAFERLIMWYVLCPDLKIPEPKLEQFYCTATQARANCAPGSLEDVGRFSGSSMRKDHRGNQLIRLLSIPKSDGTFNDDPTLMDEMIAYCEQDVRAMRAISQAMRQLSDDELMDYHVNERINDRGVLLDKALAESAIKYASVELEEIERIVAEVTEGEITSVRSPRMREWVLARVGDQAKKLMETYKDGDKKYSIDKTVRTNLLSFAEENPDEIPPQVADVIQCADDLWASSVAKFNRLKELSDEEDYRVRGAFVFAGGSATGRASSYGAQVHNFTRKCAKDPDAVRQAMVRGHAIVPTFGRRVTDVLKSMLRPALIPERGKSLVVADWAAIEARVNPWLSNCPAGVRKLELFRTGEDVYKVNAAATFHVPVDQITNEQRQIGKVQELACFAAKTKVLTDNGVKAIVDVTLLDKLWDGEKWVNHQGVIYKGNKKVINELGVQVTAEHLLKVKQDWVDAKTVLFNRSILISALATGSENLPSWVMKQKKSAFVINVWSKFNALVIKNPIMLASITYSKVLLHDVMLVLKKLLDIGEKIFLNTPMSAQMTPIAGVCSTDYLRAKIDVITQKTVITQIMAVEESFCLSLGEQIKQLFYAMLFNLKVGINRIWNWIELMLTKVTRQTIYDLLVKKITAITNDLYKKCNLTSSNLKPVYDILNSGDLNRFTIVCDKGYLIAHNCGFAGGVGAFAAMGRAYGISLPEAEAKRMVNGWRIANPWSVPYWQDLENAYTRAMRNKGYEFSAGRVTYLYDGLHLWYALPSGRVLCYPFARLDKDGVSYAKASWKPASNATEWPRARLWRGLACENITQAVANDLLRHSLRGLDDVVLHVHDEIVVETSEPQIVVEKMKEVMCTPPTWGEGLPLNIETNIMTRYGK